MPIIDITGVILTLGNDGMGCDGNGERGYEICCDECDYFLCCMDNACINCDMEDCPKEECD